MIYHMETSKMRGLSTPSVILALLLLPLTFGLAQAQWPQADMNRTIDQTNFVVNKGCSGTLISLKDRYVLTANHCVADQYEEFEREKIDANGVISKEKVRRLRDGTVSQLVFQGSESVTSTIYKVKVVAVDANRDLALLQVIGQLPNTQATALACEEATRGDIVYVVGNPMSKLYSSVVQGLVSSTQRNYSEIGLERAEGSSDSKEPLTQISGGVVGGNSGGAVYNVKGELIGVPVLAHRANEVIAFAVPLASIKAFLKDHDIDPSLYECAKPQAQIQPPAAAPQAADPVEASVCQSKYPRETGEGAAQKILGASFIAYAAGFYELVHKVDLTVLGMGMFVYETDDPKVMQMVFVDKNGCKQSSATIMKSLHEQILSWMRARNA